MLYILTGFCEENKVGFPEKQEIMYKAIVVVSSPFLCTVGSGMKKC
jgi:hypothetical protein